jgi:hypothetical protein
MSESHHYQAVLESLRELFVNYPFRAEMSTVTIATDPTGQASIMVWLRNTESATLAAGCVEWRRTLSQGNTWVWRTPSGDELYVATTGYAPESVDVSMAVIAGPLPHDCYLEHDLEPDASEEVDMDTVYRWLGDEIANNWPFKSTPNVRQTHAGVPS